MSDSSAPTRRILITGSREWTDKRAIARAIFDQFLDTPVGTHFVVVHGDCPTGADALARSTVEHWMQTSSYLDLEAHPADWQRTCDESCYHKSRTKDGLPYCPMAGPIRNQKMVDLGADVCLAFPLGDSRGTRDCMRRAVAAGIRTLDLGGAA